MIILNTFVDDDVLRDYDSIVTIMNAGTGEKSGRRDMRQLFMLEMQKVLNGPSVRDILDKLRTEPIPVIYSDNGHLRWKNERQKNYVLMMMRKKKNIPYKRTHILARGWSVMKASDPVQSGPLRGIIRFLNPDTRGIYPFVQGEWMQPFHIDTRWPDASEVIGRNSDRVQSEVIDAWLRSQILFGSYTNYTFLLKPMTAQTYWKYMSGKTGTGNATIGGGGAPGQSQAHKGWMRYLNERKSEI